MKTLKQLTLGLFFGAAALAAQAQQLWEEGTHYEVVAEQATPSPEIKEVFSYWCPHCYNFESIARQLQSQLPDNVKFTKAHVNFMGTASVEAQDAATLAMLAAKAMNQGDLFTDALFEAIHKDRTPISGMEDIKTVFAAAGGDADKLEKLTASFGIKGQVRKNNQLIQGTARVPAFIVNGKYKAIFTRDMTPDSFVELMLWLTKQN